MVADGRIERARACYERSVFGGDHAGLDPAEREPDAVEAESELSRGRIRHARFLARRDVDASENPAELPAFERALVPT